jgi:hypothetical protein
MSNLNNPNSKKFVNFVKLSVFAGKDGDLRISSKGKPWSMCRVSLGMGKDEQGDYKPSLWLTAKAFTKQDGDESLAHALGDVKKGDLLLLSGRLAYEEYTTEQGEKRSDVQLLVSKLEFPDAAHTDAGPDADENFDPPF